MGLTLSRVFAHGPAWYRGDFHAHTTASDGALSPTALSDLAAAQGLDFLAITDHNSLRAFDDFDDSYPRMVLPGIEVTLVQGHCDVFGFEVNTESVRELLHPLTGLPLARSRLLFAERSESQRLTDHIRRFLQH